MFAAIELGDVITWLVGGAVTWLLLDKAGSTAQTVEQNLPSGQGIATGAQGIGGAALVIVGLYLVAKGK